MSIGTFFSFTLSFMYFWTKSLQYWVRNCCSDDHHWVEEYKPTLALMTSGTFRVPVTFRDFQGGMQSADLDT